MTLIQKVIDIEKQELGYKEGNNNYTKYGQWYADNIAHNSSFAYAPWCAMFQTWSMAQAGVPGEYWPYESPQGSAVNYLADWLESKGFRTTADDMPEPGDIIFYSWSGDPEELDHVGLCTNVSGKTADNALLYVIEGNYNDKVLIRTIRYRDHKVTKTFRLPLPKEQIFPAVSFMLRRGDNGYAVELLQAALIYRGYDIFGGVDGYFGIQTERAVKRYQTDVEIVVDGKAGTETFSRLMGGDCEL